MILNAQKLKCVQLFTSSYVVTSMLDGLLTTANKVVGDNIALLEIGISMQT